MKLERFTDKAREAIQEAAESAREHNQSQVEPEHLLDALLAQESGVVQQIIQKAGGNILAVKKSVENEIANMPRVYGGNDPGISPRLRKVLEDAWKEMSNFKDEYLSVEHLLLALFSTEGAVHKALSQAGLNRDLVMRALIASRFTTCH
jgi:ATP-dependent Clp protease ATP-binding subunit ClpB